MPPGKPKRPNPSSTNRRKNKCIPTNLYMLTSEREIKPSNHGLSSLQTSSDAVNSEPTELDDELELFYRSMQKKLLRRSSLQKRAIEEQINDALFKTIETISEHLQSLEASIDLKLTEAKTFFDSQKSQIESLLSTSNLEFQKSSKLISDNLEKSNFIVNQVELNIFSLTKGIEDMREAKRSQLRDEIDRIKKESSTIKSRLLSSLTPTSFKGVKHTK